MAEVDMKNFTTNPAGVFERLYLDALRRRQTVRSLKGASQGDACASFPHTIGSHEVSTLHLGCEFATLWRSLDTPEPELGNIAIMSFEACFVCV